MLLRLNPNNQEGSMDKEEIIELIKSKITQYRADYERYCPNTSGGAKKQCHRKN